MNNERFFITNDKGNHIVICAMKEILQRFNHLPKHHLDTTGLIYISHRFKYKNTNRFFRKHLGFTYSYKNITWHYPTVLYGYLLTINNVKQFTLFLLRYGISFADARVVDDSIILLPG